MDDEPPASRLFGFMRRRTPSSDLEQLVPQLRAATAADRAALRAILTSSDDTPAIVRALADWQANVRLSLDVAKLRALAQKLHASTAAVAALSELERQLFSNSVLPNHLERDEVLEGEKHQTRILAEQAEQAKLFGTIDEHKTARLQQILERDRLRKRTAAARARPLDQEFEERARRQMDENEDILVAYALLESEVRKRTDITDRAKEATIEWLDELTVQELRRRMGKDRPSS
jgi:hypothetical protein